MSAHVTELARRRTEGEWEDFRFRVAALITQHITEVAKDQQIPERDVTVILALGNARFDAVPGDQNLPTARVKQILLNLVHMAVLVDENFTSQTCPRCDGQASRCHKGGRTASTSGLRTLCLKPECNTPHM
jgi:hypothetical protein